MRVFYFIYCYDDVCLVYELVNDPLSRGYILGIDLIEIGELELVTCYNIGPAGEVVSLLDAIANLKS